MRRTAKSATTSTAICDFLRQVSRPCPAGWFEPLLPKVSEDVRCWPGSVPELVAQLSARFDRSHLLKVGILRDQANPLLCVHPGLGSAKPWLFFSGRDRRPTDILTEHGFLFDSRPALLVRYADPAFQQLATDTEAVLVTATLRDMVMWQALGYAAVMGHGLDRIGGEDLQELRKLTTACQQAEFADQPQAPRGITLLNWSFRKSTSPYYPGTLDPVIRHLRKLDQVLDIGGSAFGIAQVDDEQESALHFLLQYGADADIAKFLANYLDLLSSLDPGAPRLEELSFADAVRQVIRRRQHGKLNDTTESLSAKFRQVVTLDYLVPLLQDAEHSPDPTENNLKLTAAMLTDELQACLLPRFVSRLVDPTAHVDLDKEQLTATLQLAREVHKSLSAKKAEPPQAPLLKAYPQARAS